MKRKNIIATILILIVLFLVIKRYSGKKQGEDLSHLYSSPTLNPSA
tara:strand:- start:1745 stop:1882 length:138 start_codon:yes stop_codon:yes gene_type:complete